jgi:hypothetical protein
MPNSNINLLIVDQTSPKTVYVGLNGGVFKCTDGGEKWIPAKAGLRVGQFVDFVDALEG